MTLLNTMLETCATLTKQVANLEQDKIAQAIEITKLKQRVKRLKKKRQFKSLGLKRLRKVGTTQKVESSVDTAMDDREDASKQGVKIAELDADEDVTLLDAEVAMDDTNKAVPAEVEEVIEVVIAAKLMIEVVTTAAITITTAQVPKASALRRMRGVVIQDPEETTTASNDIRPIFEKHYNLNQAFLERVEEEVIGQNEEGNKRKGENLNQDAAKKQRIDEEMILLVEKKYPLTRFTLEQMLNNVRHEVKEESEMSLELLRLVRRQLQEGYISE
nr:hypothetical protein [Tanacetum cinerariifolium]